EAAGAVSGLRLHHTAADVAREMLLATCGLLGELGALLVGYEPRVERVVASGGVVTRVPGYAQLLADAIGRPVEVSPIGESSLLGAALRARSDVVTGTATDVAPGAVYRPRPAWSAALRERREAALELAARLRGAADVGPPDVGP